MSSRLTRQDMKRDEVREQFEGFVHYLTAHWKPVVIAVVAVIVVLLAGAGIRTLLSHREADASALLARALQVASAPIGVADPKPDDEREPSFADENARQARADELFGEIRESYSRTPAGAVAELWAAQRARDEGRSQEARELWQGFLRARPDHVLTAAAKLNLIHLDREEGRGEEVVVDLEKELERVDGRVLPEDVVLYELGTTLAQLGRDAEARIHLQRLLDEFPKSGYRGEAQQQLDELSG